jgi:hypothetical protein
MFLSLDQKIVLYLKHLKEISRFIKIFMNIQNKASFLDRAEDISLSDLYICNLYLKKNKTVIRRFLTVYRDRPVTKVLRRYYF